jgi:hypothetical protein
MLKLLQDKIKEEERQLFIDRTVLKEFPDATYNQMVLYHPAIHPRPKGRGILVTEG